MHQRPPDSAAGSQPPHHSHAHASADQTAADQRWLEATWPFVRANLPPEPARIVEIGCGPLGGFVPRLKAVGYAAIGVDPEAPDGPDYRRTEFENHAPAEPLDGVIACTSLHHVADLDAALDRIDAILAPGAAIVVVEWAHERFDEATARWSFERLAPGRDNWVDRQRGEWLESNEPWDTYLRGWTRAEGLHSSADIIAGLRARFRTDVLTHGPYLFADLDDVTAEAEQAAIDANVIRALGVRYVGQKPR